MTKATNISMNVFWVGLAFTFIGGLWSISTRVRVEERNKATTLAMEYQALESAAADTGDVGALLETAKVQGLGAVVLSEQTIGDAIASGLLMVIPTDAGIVLRGESDLVRRVASALGRAFPRSWSWVTPDQTDALRVTGISLDVVRGVGIGLNPASAAIVQGAGLPLISRHSNRLGMTEVEIRATLQAAKELGSIGYLPQGEQVMGQRDLVKVTAESLKSVGMNYLAPEFAKISGDAKLAALSKENLVRLHAIQAAEVDKLAPAAYVERFTKAARERNIRILLLRPLTTSAKSPRETVTGSLSIVARGLAREGMSLGAARPFVDSNPPKIALMLIGGGTLLVGLWGLSQIGVSRNVQLLGALILLGLTLATQVSSFAGFPALAASMIFPFAAYLWWLSVKPSHPVIVYLFMSAISLAGGLSVAGLLNGLDYFVRIDQFPGVKLALFVPLLGVVALLVPTLVSWADAFKKPATWGGILGGMMTLVLVAFMLSRSGNDNPAGVSGIELQLRSLLDWAFYTRPRTKEFLVGHPALLCGLLLAARERKIGADKPGALSIGLIAAGAIGQTSIVNTLCHLHTPVLLGLARIATGLALGAVVGLVWYLLASQLLSRKGIQKSNG
jgi:hypothetical protein